MAWSWTTTPELWDCWCWPWAVLWALKQRKYLAQLSENLLSLLGDVLQLTDLFVELRNVVFDDVRQFLNLHRFVIKDGFPLA